MSRQLPKAPFTLPAEPVDRYEVQWWEVDTLIVTRPIIEHRAVYIVNATWKEIVGDDGDIRSGAPFVNNWQLFRDGNFVARNVGWTGIAEDDDHWWRAYPSYEAARTAAIEALRKRQTRLTEELDETTAAITKLLKEQA